MKKNYPIIILLALSLLAGLSTFSRYGESWDDLSLQEYATRSLNAYRTWPQQGEVQITQDDLGNYGPSYVMAVAIGTRVVKAIYPANPTDIRHLFYFLTFLAGTWAFYLLCKRWLTQTASLGATLLFLTQPLLWGHAFINPKDTPFMAFFLLSLASGFELTDSIKTVSFTPLSPSIKKGLTLLTTLWLVSVILSFSATDFLSGRSYFPVFLRARAVLTLLFTILLVYLYWRYSPSVVDLIRTAALPAVILGLTSSMRILGPLAGFIVAIYALRKKGREALPGLAIYALIAVVTMYLTWPYLWPDPIGRFAESIKVMSEFPWGGAVLFNGIEYSPKLLPITYLPVLLGLQLTEPVWVLFLCGIVLALLQFKVKQELLFLAAIWFFLPITAFIILRPAMYDNFRQILFILPPVFMMAGVAFERIKLPLLQIALIVLVSLPGLLEGVRLHPYEYIYYNHYIGGVKGTQGRFELDYWGTSYREAAEYLNNNISGRANIWVEGPDHLFGMYAKSDLRVYSIHISKKAKRYDYVVALTRHNPGETSFPDAEIVHEITCEGVPLAVIYKP